MDIPASTAPASAAPAVAAPLASGDAGASPAPSTAPTAGTAAQPDSASAVPASVQTAQPQGAGMDAKQGTAPEGTPSAGSGTAPEPAPDAAPASGPDAEKGGDITITLPDSLPPEMIDQGMLKAYTDMAKATGLTPEQAQKAADWYVEHTQHMQQQNRQAGETYLRHLWGKDFGKNMETTRLGLATMDKFMGGDISSQIVNTGLADLPVVARIFHFFGDALSENSMSSGTPAVGEGPVMDREDFVKNVINKSTPRQ